LKLIDPELRSWYNNYLGVWAPSSPKRPDWFWGPPNIINYLPGFISAGVEWPKRESWPLISV